MAQKSFRRGCRHVSASESSTRPAQSPARRSSLLSTQVSPQESKRQFKLVQQPQPGYYWELAPVLWALRCLPMSYWIQFKVPVVTYSMTLVPHAYGFASQSMLRLFVTAALQMGQINNWPYTVPSLLWPPPCGMVCLKNSGRFPPCWLPTRHAKLNYSRGGFAHATGLHCNHAV